METRTTLDGILKDVYTNVIRDQVATYSPIQEYFEKLTDFDWDGRVVREGAIVGYNEGVGSVGEDGNLPTAGNFNPQQFQIPMKYTYASFQMTKAMMESAKSSKGGFRSATRTSFDTLIRNLKRERARMLWGNGSGILARVNGTHSPAQTTIVVDDAQGVPSTVGGARFLREGMIVGFFNSSTGAHEATRAITSVAANGLSFVVASATLTDNAEIRRMSTASGTNANESGNQEPMGLLGLIDDGTYLTTLHGLSRTTFPILKSRVQAATGALSLDNIQLNFDIVDQQGDANIDCMACHQSVRRAYLSLLEADRRYTSEALSSPDGGTKVTNRKKYVTYGGVNIIEDKFAPYDTLFGLDKSTFQRYVQVEGEWANDDGAILSRVTGKDTWEAFYRIFENCHSNRPNSNFRMDGITTTKVYVASH